MYFDPIPSASLAPHRSAEDVREAQDQVCHACRHHPYVRRCCELCETDFGSGFDSRPIPLPDDPALRAALETICRAVEAEITLLALRFERLLARRPQVYSPSASRPFALAHRRGLELE